MSFVLKLGDELYAEIRACYDRPREWVVASREAPDGWTGKMISRAKRLYQQGDTDWFWVYRINPEEKRYWVSDSNFGRMPISEKLRPRYLRAARAVATVMTSGYVFDDAVLENLSEMKGIFNRCRRKDQWDWLTLYHYLEDPPSGLLEYGASQLQDLRVAIRKNEVQAIQRLLPQLEGAMPVHLIQRFIARIEESTPTLIQVKETPPVGGRDQRLGQDLILFRTACVT